MDHSDRLNVLNEVVLFSVSNGELHARSFFVENFRGTAPDEAVREAMGWNDGQRPEGAVLHSTSWRYDNVVNALLLTWAVFPDPAPSPSYTEKVVVYRNDEDADPTRPAVAPEEVASIGHAARHMAFLIAEDPQIAKAAAMHRGLKEAFCEHAPTVAGNPFQSDNGA